MSGTTYTNSSSNFRIVMIGTASVNTTDTFYLNGIQVVHRYSNFAVAGSEWEITPVTWIIPPSATYKLVSGECWYWVEWA